MLQEQEHEEEEKYFDLMEKTGTKGCYQWVLYAFCILTFFNNGLTTFNTPFLFYTPKFDCPASFTYVQCESHVCDTLTPEQVRAYPTIKEMQSLATQFGPYYCDDKAVLSYYRSCLGFSQFIGLMIAIMVSDNLSRRKAYLMCICTCTVGFLIIFLAPSMAVAVLGISICGLSNSPMLRISQTIISETTDLVLKQKFLSSMLGAFSLGAIAVGLLYSSIGHWRQSVFFCGVLPGLIIMVLFYLIVEDTPKFILHQDPQEAALSLNKICRINRVDYRFTAGELVSRIQSEKDLKSAKTIVSPIDLFRYQSLRWPSILFCMLFLLCDFLFYLHSTVIDKIGVNPQINSLIFGLGEIAAIPWAVLLIPKLKRKNVFYTLYPFAAVVSILTGMIESPSECQFCREGLLQLSLIAVTRFCFIFCWSCLYNFMIQFYPVSIMNIGIGVPTACGGLGMCIGQITILSALEDSLNVFYLGAAVMIAVSLCVIPLPQTLGTEHRDQIEEIKEKLGTHKQA